ncbi:hypothetical protein J1605_001948 [Eschrichtius robustus]|uniref:DNA repair-scaffolding protein n=1 Tax=Eschrichtius robustus TaxID=9764 RepID=A0AB34HXR8_ESCRO|nr:hypothetical protein J1605_001948 [Eschrichtius robustus]
MERLINPRVKSTETILHTPQKETKLPKTPENSAKKKKLLRGGLAERLNGLQNRERSAISLWRHQYLSYQRTLSGIKSGILTVKILELHEECTIQVAMCEQLSGLQADSSSQGGAPGTGLKVLFAKETARCLRGLPQDIIRIYPPWQKLIIPNGSCPVILNTYFCQKVVAKEDSKTAHEVHSWDTPLPRRNIILAQMFRFKSLTNNSPENQVMCGGHTTVGTDWTLRHEQAELGFPARAPLGDSLLDAVESQGVATWSGAGVRVVVQRVYSLRCRCQQADGTDPPGVRVCLLVQDALGLFSEVHSEGAVLKDRELEGKSCRLAGMKVLQKVTRGRMTELFSLIDTMWPPVAPLKAPGHGPAFEVGLQPLVKRRACSRQGDPPVLQEPPLDLNSELDSHVSQPLPVRSTVPVRVAPSCVLGQEVRDALSEATSKSFFFRDALRDQGQVVCVGRTVLLLPKPQLGVASGAWELTSPVRLDELDSVTRVNSICSVQELVKAFQTGEGTWKTPGSRESFVCWRSGAVVGRLALCCSAVPGRVNEPPGSCFSTFSLMDTHARAVVAVDESTACSWPACDLCGGERLERRPEDRGAFSCGDCSRVVTSPLLRRHLQVFLDCPLRPQCTVRVKLLQHSISSLLRFATCEDGPTLPGRRRGRPAARSLPDAETPAERGRCSAHHLQGSQPGDARGGRAARPASASVTLHGCSAVRGEAGPCSYPAAWAHTHAQVQPSEPTQRVQHHGVLPALGGDCPSRRHCRLPAIVGSIEALGVTLTSWPREASPLSSRILSLPLSACLDRRLSAPLHPACHQESHSPLRATTCSLDEAPRGSSWCRKAGLVSQEALQSPAGRRAPVGWDLPGLWPDTHTAWTPSRYVSGSRAGQKSYEVRSVLGKEVGPITCFVRSITTRPACVGLEEVELLLSEGGASPAHRWQPQDP